MPHKPSKIGVEKEILNINLAFKGDVNSKILFRSWFSSLARYSKLS